MRLKILGSIAVALLILFWLLPTRDQDQPNVDMSHLALEVFDHCINAARLNQKISEGELADVAISQFKRLSEPTAFTLKIDIEDDFACQVEVPSENYDPRALRQRLELLKASNFDGRVGNCFWQVRKQAQLASILSCSFRSVSDPANSYMANFGIVATKNALFWVQPVVIFDADGFVKLAN